MLEINENFAGALGRVRLTKQFLIGVVDTDAEWNHSPCFDKFAYEKRSSDGGGGL